MPVCHVNSLGFSLIRQIPPDSPHQTFMKVAKELFADGEYNWGRVVALFYFGYKMILKVQSQSICYSSPHVV